MTDAFTVQPDVLADALERMRSFQALSETLLREIDNVVKNLHMTWEGVGAAAHARAHQHWSHGAEQMREALGRLHQSGAGAHQNYTAAMQANEKMWS